MDDLSLPPWKYLHEATPSELAEALRRHYPQMIFAAVVGVGDDEEKMWSCWYGGSYVGIGLCEALKAELLSVVHPSEE